MPESRMWAVEGRTMLVVGLGGIGTETAQRANGLGMTVIAIRNSGTDGPPYVREVGLTKDLRAFAARADVIVDTLPLTPDTKGLFDKVFFEPRSARALHQCRPGRHVVWRPHRGAEDGRAARGPRLHRSRSSAGITLSGTRRT